MELIAARKAKIDASMTSVERPRVPLDAVQADFHCRLALASSPPVTAPNSKESGSRPCR